MAQDGDAVQLEPGRYTGHFIIDSAITLDGQGQATIDAQGTGNAIEVRSDRTHLKNLRIQNWGHDLTHTSSGIKAVGVKQLQIEHNDLAGDGFGIYLEQVSDSVVSDNAIQGNAALRSADRGNGVHLISVSGVEVSGNRINATRDGLYIINSQHNSLLNNHMSDLRFGVHYMYSHSNRVDGNAARQVRVGYALMSSNDLSITNNSADDCSDYGLLLNFVNTSYIAHNSIHSIHADSTKAIQGDVGKALFIYNALNNRIEFNTFADSDLGIHLTAGSEGNVLTQNNFINNQTQVKYVSTREQEWSLNQQGNFWSNYMGWDLDHNGIGDTAFAPNDGVDKLIWRYPEARVLMDSPAVLLLRWVQKSFPILKSPGVTDSYPLLDLAGGSS
jgi:nitrous oxidase accessory protein